MIRSAPVAGDGTQRRARAWVALVCTLATAAAIVAACLALAVDLRAAGVAAGVGGAGLVAGRVLAERARDVRGRLFVSLADRAFDGAVLASAAWATRETEPPASAGALLALGAGFLAAYVRARGEALGYRVPEGLWTRAVQVAWLAAVLLGGWTRWGLLALAAWMLAVTGVRVSQVVKEERA